jgi:hypothetical protein
MGYHIATMVGVVLLCCVLWCVGAAGLPGLSVGSNSEDSTVDRGVELIHQQQHQAGIDMLLSQWLELIQEVSEATVCWVMGTS